MRNIVLAKAVGEDRGIPAAALVVYPDLPHLHIHKEVNGPEWSAFHSQVDQDQVTFDAVSYQDLLKLMKAQSDGQNWHELEIWMAGKYAAESA